MNTITDLTTICTILKEFKADSVLLTQYTPTFRRVVLYFTKKDTTATLYLIVIGSKYIQGNFSWHNPSFEITYNEITQEYLIEDKANGFCLICDGGVILVESTTESNFEIIQ